ncbi:MAG: hypothetical protein CL882_04150 [Dehalococcoidia bacterium]|nr:hypothetical protein [Dehalococcoidia bacterium]
MKIYDLHNHLLPSVDDGPGDINESLEIVRISSDQNIEFILATPHRKDVTELHSVAHIKKLTDQINDISLEKGYLTKIKLGMENHIDITLPEDIRTGYALTMNYGPYILLEMPWDETRKEKYIDDVLDEVKEMGLIPVIAHPERMEIFKNNYGYLKELVGRGMLMQLTSSSLYGKFGSEAKVFSHEILKDGFCHIIASDTHMAFGQREQDLINGFETAKKLIGQEAARELVSDNPRILLNID